ncbi:GntR family transcriptional regulator [Candidimonas nitroreducens]|uniref:GntR family transcriptional regulator n=1 Tax=Candidimonas nitroreducens TaxID=683354 RepID=A0A225M7W8_9BURK|nr:GntR family transcriptional regulator [Candidimonas nitroreducens]OWT55651.1 GntR family transcriptional regulator [Candidimonas nitroreducens]
MPVSKHNTQFFAAYNDIKQKILSGFFSHDDRLREIEVANLLGMGRTPVREALKRLEDERLLTHEPRRGLVVTRIDQQGVTELYAMREILEAAAAEFAARHATDAEIDNMESILAEESRCGDDPVALNLAFHDAIYGAAHNQHLIRSLKAVTETTYLLGRSTLQNPQRSDVALGEHRAIVAAIRARDPRAAAEAARHHIRQAFLERLKILRERVSAPDPHPSPKTGAARRARTVRGT